MDAGCLSSKQMLLDLRHSINTLDDQKQRDSFKGIYDFILSSLSYQITFKNPDLEALAGQLPNIEDFVMLLRQLIDREFIIPSPLVASWNDKISIWESRDGAIFTQFLDFIYERLLKKWLVFDEGKAADLVAPIKALIGAPERFNVSIFSLNYDQIFEKNFLLPGEDLLDDGFSSQTWDGEFEDPASPAKIKLYKLHGSSNWYFDELQEQVRCRPPGEVGDVRPLIIFGSSYKMQSYDPFLTLLSSFKQKLDAATLFVVIGYSFQDRYINNILIQSLNSDPNRIALIVDPGLQNKTNEQFVNQLENTQKAKSLTEVINLTKISYAKVKILPVTAKAFFQEYLGNNAAKLSEELSAIESESLLF
nr:hypothetical protein BdHM001_02930 [Bdellovibrio sp. HM001]